MRLSALFASAMALSATAAHAQTPRPAVSADLTAQDAAAAFENSVLNVCLASVSKAIAVDNLPDTSDRPTMTLATDAVMREQAGATDLDKVWNVETGRGVVTIKARSGRCAVSVYGPPATPTMIAMSAKLTQPDIGLERMATTGGRGLSQTLYGQIEGRRVQVILTGSDPGQPGHESRFSVVTATVFEMLPE